MYSEKDKNILLNILYQNDFDIKNSVIQFNTLTKNSLERGTVYDWIKLDENFKTKYSYFKEDLIKESESAHRKLRNGIPMYDENGEILGWIEKPDRAAIEFFLKTIGKEHGYIEKSQVEHSGEIKTGQLTQEERLAEIAKLKADLNGLGL